MAHFARLIPTSDPNLFTVAEVLVVSDDQEHRCQEFLADDLGLGGTWLQTSYNGTIRKNYAGVGYTYDAGRDAFIAPKPFNSWVLNETTCQWEAPVAYPGGGEYRWDEESQAWI